MGLVHPPSFLLLPSFWRSFGLSQRFFFFGRDCILNSEAFLIHGRRTPRSILRVLQVHSYFSMDSGVANLQILWALLQRSEATYEFQKPVGDGEDVYDSDCRGERLYA